MTKHVYILGAGFSVPLGGPLFSQLLTRELSAASEKIDLDEPDKTAARELQTRMAIKNIRKFEHALGRTERMNAEEVLETIDTAASFPSTLKSDQVWSGLQIEAKLLSLGLRDDEEVEKALRLRSFLGSLKRVIAAQCQDFIQYIGKDSDRVSPFLRWYDSLGPQDSIVTFNYDTAIELLAEYSDNWHPPREPNWVEKEGPSLIKLHGSVNWIYGDSGLEIKKDAYKYNVDLALGLPGKAKGQLHTPQNSFYPLWNAAKRKLREAEVVSIVGYSMPQTDNIARATILNAIAAGTGKRVNLVLGPASGTSVAKRMLAMLKPIVSVENVYDLPMYAQDYVENVERYRFHNFD